MATKSSIHIKPCNIASSEAHNRRTAEYIRNIGESRIYVVSKLSTNNEQWVNPDFGTTELRTHYDNIKRMVKEKTGRAMQEKERERKGKNGKIIKVPVFIDTKGRMCKLFGGKNGNLYKKYELSYEDANRAMQTYLYSENRGRGAESLRVSLYLDNAKCGDLHLFAIAFDKVDGKVDTKSAFFTAATSLAALVSGTQ